MKTVRIGLLGMGTVGASVVDLLFQNASEIERRTHCRFDITHALVSSLHKPRSCDCGGIEVTTNPDLILENPDIDVIVELIGGIEPAKSYVMRALKQKKSVVTANKALLAHHGMELAKLAQDNGVTLAFEAAVAGAIPLIKVIREGLTANRIEWLAGIINGTGNYILSKMHKEGVSFESALAQAQALGFAEADPTFDVQGIDAAHKLSILATLAFGIPLDLDGVYTEGIGHVTEQDVKYATELGYCIKQLAIARRHGAGIELRVHPTLISEDCLLAHVNQETNAVLVKSDAAGASLFYGKGAGGFPTASAVIADLIDVGRADSSSGLSNNNAAFGYALSKLHPLRRIPIAELEMAYYLRLKVMDKPGILAQLTRILAEQKISIQSIIQKGVGDEKGHVPIVILTHPAKESGMNQAIHEIALIDGVLEPVMRLRIDPLDSMIV